MFRDPIETIISLGKVHERFMDLGKNDKNVAQVSTVKVGEGAGCSDCNFDNKPDSKFCEMCGTQL